MILINPTQELILPCRQTMYMKGFLRVQIRRPDGRVRWDSGFFPNKILDAGRNNMASQTNWLIYCHVGTGATPPTAVETQLENFVVSTNTIHADSNSTQGSAPYYGWRRKTFRFAVGAGHGGENLSEAGIGWGAAGSTLVSRALILDPTTQLPTTVTPQADELLDVTYEMRYYPPLTDAINSVTLNGVDYTTTTRASIVTNDMWSKNIGMLITYYSAASGYWLAYDGNIGTITQAPSGNSQDPTTGNPYAVAYSNNSYARRIGDSVGTSDWVLGAGIRSLTLNTKAGAYQTQLAATVGGATVPKTTLHTMIFEWVINWAEYT
jgi:hypothetical protein